MLMDAPGIREELHEMARRVATTGYCVLLPNLYYRAGSGYEIWAGRPGQGERGLDADAGNPDEH